MTAPRYQTYPAYKDSGVEWLGEIPAHWEVKPLKALSDLQTGLTLGKKYEGRTLITRPYLRVANVQDGYLDLDDVAEVELLEQDAARYELRGGDVLMTEGGDFDKLGRGYIWESQVAQCLHQNHIFAVRPRRELLSSRYLSLMMSSGYGRAYFTATSKQSTNLASTNSTKLRNLPMPAPSLPEQCAIAAFLDRETARIDALMAKKERLIELLREQRTALITRAVTKGLDPKVPMKDSGVEWLGEIPAHWVVRAVWTLFALGRGRVISHEKIHEDPGLFPVYSSQTENDGVMGYLATYDFDGDYLTWTTDGARAGTVFSRSGKFNCTNVCGTLLARRAGRADLAFVRDALNIATAWFVRHDINPKLMNNVMGRIRVQVPPEPEGRAIAAFLERETARIDALVSKVREAIDRLKELRTALISAAVTGKIDVREEIS